MKNLLNHLMIIISIYILIFFSIKYLSIKNNYITIKIIYNSACVIDKQIDSKLISLIGDDIDIDLIKPHCEDGIRRNHRGFIISKNKLDTLLELINEVDLNLHAQQIIESSINRNNKILKLFDKNLLYTLEDPSLDMSNISSQINKFVYKTLKENNELKFAKENYKTLFKIVEINEQKKINYFDTKMSLHLTFIFYPILLFLIFMYRNRALGFVIK